MYHHTSESTVRTPLLVMLKKIWVNGNPDIDPVADQIFHYPQVSGLFILNKGLCFLRTCYQSKRALKLKINAINQEKEI